MLLKCGIPTLEEPVSRSGPRFPGATGGLKPVFAFVLTQRWGWVSVNLKSFQSVTNSSESVTVKNRSSFHNRNGGPALRILFNCDYSLDVTISGPMNSPALSSVAPGFREKLEGLHYQSIAACESSVQSDLEKYLVVRANLILGEYPQATRCFQRFFPSVDSAGFIARFLQAQLALFCRADYSEALHLFYDLEREGSSDPYLEGEFHFLFGYLHNLRDEYQLGLRHHLRAVDAYSRADLSACQSIALFNLCVAYDHLNERHLLNRTLDRLERLTASMPDRVPTYSVMRLQTYRKIDQEAYSDALGPCLEVWRRYLAEGRYRDLGDMAAHILYLYLKTGNWEAFSVFLSDLEELLPKFSDIQQSAVQEFRWLGGVGVLSGGDGLEALERWKSLRLTSVRTLFLMELALERLMRGGDYEALLQFSKKAEHYALKTQHALTVVDFRYYEIVARMRLGQLEKARSVWSMYRSDAQAEGAEARIQKATLLLSELDSAYSPGPSSAGEVPRSLVVDEAGGVVEVDGTRMCLNRRPLVLKLLKILALSKKPIPMGEVFESLYSIPFHSLDHEKRVSSLIDRARQVLNHVGAILRVDGSLRLAPHIHAEVIATGSSAGAITRRRLDILALVHRAAKPMSISEIESRFDCTRRTLQHDLKYLVRNNALQVSGGTRQRKYRA